MRKTSALILAIFISLHALAQMPGDTIVVKSLDYNATTRDTIVSFPNLPNVAFEKILMLYNMRCKGALVSDGNNRNRGCGEWDYSCNTYITDSTKIDSTIHSTNNYIIPGLTGNALNYITSPINDYHRAIQPNVTVNSISAETQSVVNNGTASIGHAIPTAAYGAKSQYLYTTNEMLLAGVSAGNLDGILLNVLNTGTDAKFLKVKIKHTSKTQLDASAPDTSGFTEVFFHNTLFAVGPNRLQFHTPFNWNGTSNVIIEFTYTNTAPVAANIALAGAVTANTSGIHSQNEQLFYFKTDNYIEADNYKGIPASDPRTVEAWIKTSVADKEICSWGRNAGNVKWVFRLNNGGQLRVENGNGAVIGSTLLNDNKWHHVACTFNGNTLNDVKLYVDGQLETNSSNSGTPITTDTAGGLPLRISRGVNDRYFEGYIENVRVWDIDLSAATLQNWMYKKLDATHPNAANLKVHYQINAASGITITDQSAANHHATVKNGAIWQQSTGEQHFKDFVEENQKPSITFLQGTYLTTTSYDTTWLAVAQIPLIGRATQIIAHPGTLMNDEIIYGPDSLYWSVQNGERYYDENNILLQTVAITPTDSISISPLSFVRREAMQFEIMSFVTPYGINLDLGPTGKTWTFDLTDFSPILKGDKRMLMTMGGQWQEEMDIQFLFIVGTPPADVHDINNIWKSLRSSTYTSINNNSVFPPRDIALPATSSAFKIRSSVTGHGQEGEFIPRNHHINIDGGANEFSWAAWKECAANPVYPQGGTWIYDRAGWCPGMATDVQEFNINQYVSPGQTHSFDYDVDVASGDSRYIVSHQLVSYGQPNHTLDARITDIINPSSRIEFARENPICKTPVVRIQSVGSTPLTAAKIEYGLNGIHQLTKPWSGNLAFMETAEVELDAPTWFWDNLNGPNNNTFYAKIIEPNGGTDVYPLNDKMTTPFEITGVFPSEAMMIYKANSAFTETKIEILDDNNNIVFSKVATGASLTFDTLTFNNGCYTLLVTDNDDDGFDFWANNDGAGLLRITDKNGNVLLNVDGDFGKYYRYNFTVNFPLSYQHILANEEIKIYPNPTDDLLNITSNLHGPMAVEIYDAMGKRLQLPLENEPNKILIHTAGLSAGVYYLQIQQGEKRTVKKLLIQH